MKKNGKIHEDLLLDNVSDAIISTKPDFTIVSWNKAAELIYGWTMEEAIGRQMGELVKIRYIDIDREKIIQSFFAHNEWEGETEQYTKSGKPLYIYSKIRLVRDEKGNPFRLVAVNRDISHRKNAEKNLLVEKEINAVLAEISESIISPDMSVEQIAFMVHKASMQLTASSYGYASSIDPADGANVVHTFSEMMANCNVRDKRIIFQKGPKGYKGLWGHSLNTGKGFFVNDPEAHEASIGLPEGHIPLNNFLSVPAVFNNTAVGQIALADKQGGYTETDLETIKKLANIYAAAIFRTQTENELHAAIERIQESDRLKSTFLASMSHEIRTPLNAILGFLDIVLSDEDVSMKHREYLTQVKQSGNMLLQIINDILDFSKIEADELTLEAVSYSLKELFGRIEGTGRMLLEGKQVKLRIVFPESANCVVYGDPYRLEQVLMNLVSNAVKFTEKGSIELGVALENDNLLRFSVKDTGAGIPTEKQDIIFEAFRQAEEKTTRKYGGTGLGLAISKRLIEKMGGTISFETTPGKGTQFFFTLPLVRGDVNWDEAAAERDAAATSNTVEKPVLIVDDNEINRRVIQTMLSKAGFRFIAAKNGADGVTALQRDREIGLVLMDMYMPVLDGIEATKRIRELEHIEGREPVPIIALTAAGTLEDRQLMLDAGCNGYLSKPINRQVLIEQLKAWL